MEQAEKRKTPEPDCPNCDGRGCMGCVLREYDHTCRDDCPFCCEVAEIQAAFSGKTRIAELEDAIRHVLRCGKLGKQSERRLRGVLEGIPADGVPPTAVGGIDGVS